MKLRTYVALTAFSLAGLAHGQISLDWESETAWRYGSVTGSFNSLSGAGGGGSAIHPLIYDFGGGLTAEVSFALSGAVSWQNGAGIYGGYAPRTENGVLALGVSGANDTTGASLTLNFNRAVRLSSFTIGDLDISGARDLVRVGADGALLVLGFPDRSPGVTGNGASMIVLSGIDVPETTFNTSASSAWISLGSGPNWINSLSVTLSGGTNAHGIWLSDVSFVSPIPEPSTYALALGLGVLAVCVARRRRARSP